MPEAARQARPARRRERRRESAARRSREFSQGGDRIDIVPRCPQTLMRRGVAEVGRPTVMGEDGVERLVEVAAPAIMSWRPSASPDRGGGGRGRPDRYGRSAPRRDAGAPGTPIGLAEVVEEGDRRSGDPDIREIGDAREGRGRARIAGCRRALRRRPRRRGGDRLADAMRSRRHLPSKACPRRHQLAAARLFRTLAIPLDTMAPFTSRAPAPLRRWPTLLQSAQRCVWSSRCATDCATNCGSGPPLERPLL